MKTIDARMTLGELVDAHPQLARQFEQRGLDYCCGGRRSLADVCAERSLDTAAIVDELSATITDDARGEWSSMSAIQLVDHIESTHHRYLWEELPRLSALLDKVVSVHGERHPELNALAACFAAIRADLEPHLRKEEQVLFPMISELATAPSTPSFACGPMANPISVMLREHDAVGVLLAQLRRLTDDYTPPVDACASYTACFAGLATLEDDTHLHIHKENNVLFPLVERLESPGVSDL